MTYTTAATDPDIVAAFARGAPCFLAGNLLKSNLSETLKWTDGSSGGLQASTDVTDPTAPTSLLYDGRLTLPSRASPTPATNTTFYLNWELDGLVPVDAISFYITYVPTSCTVTVEAATSNTFGTTATLASTTVSQAGRHVFLLNTTYSNVIYCRMTFSYGATAYASPEMSELFIGRRRQFSRNLLGPLDKVASSADARRFVSLSRDSATLVHSDGFFDQRMRTDFDGDGLTSIDDVAVFTGLQDDLQSGALPFWVHWFENAGWMFGRFEETAMVAPVAQGEFDRQQWEFEFREQPPFLRKES